MKRKFFAIVLCLTMMMALAGCSLFTSSSDGEKNSGNTTEDETKQTQTEEEDKGLSIEMTDSYTFTDPQDIEFDDCIALTGDSSSKLVSDMNNFGFTVERAYDILYIKEDKPVREYTFFVCADETAAADLMEYYSSMGQQTTQEKNIVYAIQDGETIEATIMMYEGMGEVTDTTPEAYMEFNAEFNGMVEYK